MYASPLFLSQKNSNTNFDESFRQDGTPRVLWILKFYVSIV